jgi:hypothetical protein
MQEPRAGSTTIQFSDDHKEIVIQNKGNKGNYISITRDGEEIQIQSQIDQSGQSELCDYYLGALEFRMLLQWLEELK